jgi:hypothetical protein
MMIMTSEQRRTHTFLGIAQIAYAQWFFGNLYEWIVRVPSHLAEDGHLESVLSAGSPVLYYLPCLAIVIGATVAALITGWKCRMERRRFSVLALSVSAGLFATAYLVWAVNLKVFMVNHSVSSGELHGLLALWYRANAMRLVTTACAWITAANIQSRLSSDPRRQATK